MHYRQKIASKLVISVPVADLSDNELQQWVNEAIVSFDATSRLINNTISPSDFLEIMEPCIKNLDCSFDEYVENALY